MAVPVSDSRILSVLGFGTEFCHAVDSSGILRNSSVRRLSYDSSSGIWSMLLVFSSGLEMVVAGTLTDGSVRVVSACLLVDGGKVPVPMNPSSDVLSSFGMLSALPAALRSNLAVPVYDGVGQMPDAVSLVRVFSLCLDALFYGVEGGGENDGFRGRFSRLDLLFNFGGDGVTVSALLRTSFVLDEGRVIVSSNIDFYGLNSKMVRLDYNLGMGRHIRSECFLTRDKKTVPSLRLAFDLADQLSGLYSKQRRKKESIGKPRSAVSK